MRPSTPRASRGSNPDPQGSATFFIIYYALLLQLYDSFFTTLIPLRCTPPPHRPFMRGTRGAAGRSQRGCVQGVFRGLGILNPPAHTEGTSGPQVGMNALRQDTLDAAAAANSVCSDPGLLTLQPGVRGPLRGEVMGRWDTMLCDERAILVLQQRVSRTFVFVTSQSVVPPPCSSD